MKCVLCQTPLQRISSYEWGDSFYCDTINCSFRASLDGNRQDIDHYHLDMQIDDKRYQFFTSKYADVGKSITKIIDNSTKKALISFPYFTPYTEDYAHYHYFVSRFVKLKAFI